MSFLLSSSGKQKLCMFEIRLDESFIVFRGPESETPATECSGIMVFMTNDPIPVKGIRLVLEGRRRTQHNIQKTEVHSGLPASANVTNRSTFLRLQHDVKDEQGRLVKMIPPGNHQFRFSFPLAGDTPESIEGMTGNHIVYDLKATAERGFATKDIVARKHLRIIRTLGPDAMESAVASAVYGVWPDKLKYHFEPAAKNWVFGTTIQTQIELTPLLAKLGIERIKFTLKEIRKIKTEPGPEYSTTQHKWVGMWKEEHDVFTGTMQLPENCEDVDLDTQLPMFRFTATWKLPKSLKDCRQSVENNDWIQIKHAAHYDILLKNPDGHLSELKAHHPARLFISPNLPVGDNDEVATSPNEQITGESDPLDQSAPPTYGSHLLDQLVPLYEGIDPSGFFTPGLRSGSATPSFSSMASRNASHDNLASLSMTANAPSPNAGALRRRLNMINGQNQNQIQQHSQGQHPDDASADASPGDASGHASDDDARRASDPAYFSTSASNSHLPRSTSGRDIQIRDRHHAGIASSPPDHDDLPGVEEHDYDMNVLGRMPSYNTAVKTNPRAIHAETPPTYGAAVSRPPSPVGMPLPPMQAHLRQGTVTPRSRGA